MKSVSPCSAEESAVQQVERGSDRSVRPPRRSNGEHLAQVIERDIHRRTTGIDGKSLRATRFIDALRARSPSGARGVHDHGVSERKRRFRALRGQPQSEASEEHAQRARQSPALAAHPWDSKQSGGSCKPPSTSYSYRHVAEADESSRSVPYRGVDELVRAPLDLFAVLLMLEQRAQRVLRDLGVERTRPQHHQRARPIQRLCDRGQLA